MLLHHTLPPIIGVAESLGSVSFQNKNYQLFNVYLQNHMKKYKKKCKMPRAKMRFILGCLKPAAIFSRLPKITWYPHSILFSLFPLLQGGFFNWLHQNLAKSRMKLDTPKLPEFKTRYP